MRRLWRVALDAFQRFNDNDGWAVASHIALSALMSMFPFLIFVTALAALFDLRDVANETVRILLEAWPAAVAVPMSEEIRRVLTSVRTDVLTYSVVVAIFFSTMGVEAVRTGLNRAYGLYEERPWWRLRLQSTAYVLIAAVALLALSLLVVLWPLLWGIITRYVVWLEPLGTLIAVVRIGAAALVLIVALFVAHKWLPAGRRGFREVAPGILVTLVLWLASGMVFGLYLGEFAHTYVTYYAGLASVMIALVFLYLVAAIFIFGGELNAAIQRARKRG